MKKLFFLLLVIFSTSAFAQKVEHGVLVGGGIGFPMQDSKQLIPLTNELRYDHNLKGNGMIGYRLRFLPQRKHFFDLDLTIGFQGMSTQKYVPFLSKQDGTYTGNEGDEFSEFVMPISLAASWNYRITGKFFFGLGIAPTLYVRPQAVFDLPVLKPNCRDMHKVERKETIFSISRLYGITEAELIAANPELRTEKLKKGKFLCIPYPKDTKTETPVDNTPAVIPTDDQLFNESKKEARKISTIKAAVMLPFMTDGKGNRDEQTRMVEYYEGFLMAVDSLKEKGVSIDLYSYDTHNNTSSIKNILDRSELKSMDIIFGPAYPDQVKPVAEFAKKNNIRLVVPFTSKGNEVFSNPAIYQINTPQSYLYSEVYEHFTRKFTTANVIFLDAEDGDKDKVDFIKGLKEELKTKRIPFTELKGENITPESLKGAMNHSMDNVFIPTSGTNVALIKLLPQLIVTSRDNPDYRMQLFGYPEWQTYTNDHLASFYELDTYFYSSFYTNNLFPEAVQFSSAYRKWYSKDMLNSFPKYGMLGFDTGYFFLKGLSQYGNKLEDKLDKVAVTPIQTGFKFERVNNWGGFINRKVFFVHFTKDFELIKLDFE